MVNSVYEDALMVSCWEGRTDIVKALLEAFPEIDVNKIRDENGNRPLHDACDGEYIDVVKALLAHGNIDVNIQNTWKQTPLQRACFFGDIEPVKALLTHPKIDPNIQDGKNKIALDIACEEGHTEIFSLLENFINEKEQKEKQLTQEFCLAMIQPDLPVVPSTNMSRKRKAKELRRDELRLGSDLIKKIASYLEWKDISKKSGFEIKN